MNKNLEREKRKRKTRREERENASPAKTRDKATGADDPSLDVESAGREDQATNDEVIAPDGSPSPKQQSLPLY